MLAIQAHQGAVEGRDKAVHAPVLGLHEGDGQALKYGGIAIFVVGTVAGVLWFGPGDAAATTCLASLFAGLLYAQVTPGDDDKRRNQKG